MKKQNKHRICCTYIIEYICKQNKMYIRIKVNKISIATVKIVSKSVYYELNKKRFKIYLPIIYRHKNKMQLTITYTHSLQIYFTN